MGLRSFSIRNVFIPSSLGEAVYSNVQYIHLQHLHPKHTGSIIASHQKRKKKTIVHPRDRPRSFYDTVARGAPFLSMSAFQIASAPTGSTAAGSSFFPSFSCSGRAVRPGNIAAAATRVAVRRRTRARQSRRATVAAMTASPPRTPPTIAPIFLEDELPCETMAACDEDSPGTAVCVVVGVAGAARVPGWPALTSVASTCRPRSEHSVLNEDAE
ncbi:hypothetical protein EDB92DRAFT_332255 [Lactarius akahatsu]|uniref:Uncharacterized protein n=1 Tax=Lactarius akahatsu TaxID=416441 RepID=A0AAD4Q2Y9_9AGAM|nr:hypothetical protein EDB92DRAFT_332255 [Lactarius akahatsu]